MIEKLACYLNTVAIQATKLKKPVLWLGMAYLFAVAVMTAALICAWFLKWNFNGSPDIPLGLQILDKLIGPYMVAFVTFICGLFIDINKDGVPDELEKGGRNV